MLINRRLQNSGTTSKTIGNPDLPEDVLALCYFQRHQRRPQNDPRGLRLQGRDRYRQAQFHPTEALAILSAARQETDPLLRWAPLVMHTPAAGSVSCWARPRLPSNSATGFGVWRSRKGVPRRAVNSDAEGARERTSRSGSFRWRRRCWSMPRRLSGSNSLKNAPSPAEGSSHRSITIWTVLSFVTPKRSLATSGFVMKASTDVAARTGGALWSASRSCNSRGACSCNQT